jgi:oligopeptide transport system substrate-binding protein
MTFYLDFMKFKQLKTFNLLTVLLAGLVGTGAFALPPPGVQLASEQVFRRGNGDEVESLDPQKATSIPATNVLIDLYEGLVTQAPDGRLIPGQADRWEVSADGRQYTFHLRPNLKWSNGEPLVAADFVAGMRRTVDVKVGSVYADFLASINNAPLILAQKLPVDQLGVRAPDDHTVVIVLERPVPYFLQLLTHPTAFPIYRPALQHYGEQFTQPGRLVSNGPFFLKSWVVQANITLEKSKQYWNEKEVVLQKVIFYPIQQRSVELQRYRANDIDYTNAIPAGQFAWLQRKFPEELKVGPVLTNYYFDFNVTRPPFAGNVNLRKALALAIDKQIITQNILGGGQIPLDSFVPLGVANYTAVHAPESKLSYPERVALARDYYQKAGYSPQKPAQVKITYNTDEAHKNIAVAVSAMWKKNLGVETELLNQEWKVFLRTKYERKETEVFRSGWVADYNDPSTFLDLYAANNPQNASGYHNPKYDALLEKAKSELDLTVRANILAEAELLLLSEQPMIPIYTSVSNHLIKKSVGGFTTNIFDRIYDRDIYIQK